MTYSIIIPHRDIPQLLQRCLASVPQRPDLEVIVVDDNSNPDVVDFDHFPGLERPDTTVIFDKTGLGAGHARNVGLEYAKGKWLLFADADDYFHPNAFCSLATMTNSDYHMVCFCVDSCDSATGLPVADRLPGLNNAIKKREFERLRYSIQSPCGRMVLRSLVEKNQLHFEEIPVANDVAFAVRVGYYAQNIGIVDDYLYCATRRRGSLWYKKTPERLFIRTCAAMRMNDFLWQHGLWQYETNALNLAMQLYPLNKWLFIRAIRQCSRHKPKISYYKEIFRKVYQIERRRIANFYHLKIRKSSS